MSERRYIPYAKASNIVIDIESLGLKPGSVILSIGAAHFKGVDEPIQDTFYGVIHLTESVWNGFTIDSGTLDWWNQQDSDVFRETLGMSGPVPARPLTQVMEEFHSWCKSKDPDYYWGNSPDFDMVLLTPYFKAAHLENPWKYYQLRDFRTYADPGIVTEAMRDEVAFQLDTRKHHAECDAVFEAELLRRAISLITPVIEICHAEPGAENQVQP